MVFIKKAPESCNYAAQAIRFYRSRTNEWRARFSDRYPDRIKWPTCFMARRAAKEWQARAFSARRSFERWYADVGRIVERLERVLEGTPMEGSGIYLERHGRRWGVSPFFMVATAATESSIGRAACGAGGYNAWGLGNCGSAWSVPAFGSWDEAIAYYARFLAHGWPGHSSPFSFRGYAACDDCWGRKVSSWMSSLFGVPARTAYP